jgi:hypothetical protein
MFPKILAHIDFIYVFISITSLLAWIFLPKTKPFHFLILIILSIDFFTETSSNLLRIFDLKIALLYNISILFHHSLWLWLLLKNAFFPKLGKMMLLVFILFGVFNLLFGEGISTFNFSTFIVGALLYLIGFIVESFFRLKQEDFAFFHQNDFIVLSAPLLFFIGFSMMFGFRNHDLNAYLILGKWELYTVISHMGNIIYYGMILWYVYMERQAFQLLKRV